MKRYLRSDQAKMLGLLLVIVACLALSGCHKILPGGGTGGPIVHHDPPAPAPVASVVPTRGTIPPSPVPTASVHRG